MLPAFAEFRMILIVSAGRATDPKMSPMHARNMEAGAPYSATLCHFFSESMAAIQSIQPSKSTSAAMRGFYLGSIGLRLSCHRLRSHQSDGIHSLPTIRWCGCYSECQQHQEGHVTQPAKCDWKANCKQIHVNHDRWKCLTWRSWAWRRELTAAPIFTNNSD